MSCSICCGEMYLYLRNGRRCSCRSRRNVSPRFYIRGRHHPLLLRLLPVHRWRKLEIKKPRQIVNLVPESFSTSTCDRTAPQSPHHRSLTSSHPDSHSPSLYAPSLV